MRQPAVALRRKEREADMELSIRLCAYDRLQGLSFTEVYRAFADLVHRNWEKRQVERHIVRRARQCYRKRRQQPDYAAILLVDRPEDGASTQSTAW